MMIPLNNSFGFKSNPAVIFISAPGTNRSWSLIGKDAVGISPSAKTMDAFGIVFRWNVISAETREYSVESSLPLQKTWNSQTPSVSNRGDLAIIVSQQGVESIRTSQELGGKNRLVR